MMHFGCTKKQGLRMGIRRMGFFGIPTPEVEMLVALRADVSAKDRRNKHVVHCCFGWVGVRKDTHLPLEVFVRPKMSRVFFPQRFIGRLILIFVDVTNSQLKWLVSYEIQSASSSEGICNSIQTNLEKSREIIMKTGRHFEVGDMCNTLTRSGKFSWLKPFTSYD